MSKSTWTGAVNSGWADPDNWTPAGVPGVNSDVVIASGAPVASASIGRVNSITDSGGLRFRSAGSNTVTTFLDNSGELRVDRKGGAGGTILNIAGKLTNNGSLRIGNATLSAPDTVTAASLDNTGEIRLLGSRSNQALLNATGSAGFGTAGVLSGKVQLTGDSAIEFKSGQITSVAGSLALNGNNAFIEDSTALGSNSALMGLASIGARATFDLENGASVSTTGALANKGFIGIDTNPNGGHGGSSLTVAGALTNSGGILIGRGDLSASDKLTADTLSNSGSITLDGGGAQALLDVTTGAAGLGTAGTLTGSVNLFTNSAIEFVSGQINTIAAGAVLEFDGNSGFIEDRTALGSNSALTGLTDIAGNLQFLGDDSVSTTGSVTNSGFLGVDYYYARSGSTLSIGGALTNTGMLEIGAGVISSSCSVTAKSFVNSGTVDLTGNGTNFAALDVSGATTNNGSISIVTDTEELAGAVGGTGSFSLSNANLQFDSSVSSGQTIDESGADALVLGQAQKLAATISGFGTGDTIDAANFLLSGTTFNFIENSGGAGGTLTLHDAGLTANILMTGHYSNSNFTLAPDSGTGTLVKFV